MGIAKNFNRALHKELGIYAAWYPIANTFEVGDYGLVRKGVFRKLGNIAEYGIDLNAEKGNSASIDFLSDGTTIVRTVGGAEVPALEGVADVEAKITFDFESENASLIKASLEVLEMQNVNAVARKLADHDDWSRRFRVVSAVYTGTNSVVICSRESGTKVKVSGTLGLLKEFEAGSVKLQPTIEVTKDVAFKSIGESGPIGLSLFKLGLFKKVRFLDDDQGSEGDDLVVERDWGDELEDDE
jgi:hypothetical protein